jgi:hypothetical protein
VLQAWFGTKICRTFTRDPIQVALGGALFATTPLLPIRVLHIALSGLFFVTAGVWLNLARVESSAAARRGVLMSLVLLIWAAGTHAYLSVMLIVLSLATLKLLDGSQAASSNNRSRDVAAQLAQSEQDAIRQMPITALAGGYHPGPQQKIVGNITYTTPGLTAFLTVTGDDQKLGFPGGRLVDPSIGLNELVTNRRGTSTPFDYGNQQGASATSGFTKSLWNGAELIVDGGFRERQTQSGFFGATPAISFASTYNDAVLKTWSITPRLSASITLIQSPRPSLMPPLRRAKNSASNGIMSLCLAHFLNTR